MSPSQRFGEQPIAAYDERISEIEDIQFTLGQGPGIDASATGAAVFGATLQEYEHKWPQFVPAALERGAQGVMALPLQVGSSGLGVLTLYSDGQPFTRTFVTEALIVNELVVEALLAEQATVDSDATTVAAASDGLDSAITHQATGMISVQTDCPVEEALVRLRAYAFANNRTVFDVARDVVNRELRFANDTAK